MSGIFSTRLNSGAQHRRVKTVRAVGTFWNPHCLGVALIYQILSTLFAASCQFQLLLAVHCLHSLRSGLPTTDENKTLLAHVLHPKRHRHPRNMSRELGSTHLEQKARLHHCLKATHACSMHVNIDKWSPPITADPVVDEELICRVPDHCLVMAGICTT